MFFWLIFGSSSQRLARIVVPERVGDGAPDLVALGAWRGHVQARVRKDVVVVDEELLAEDGHIGGIPGYGGGDRVADEEQAIGDIKRLLNAVDDVADAEAGRVGAIVQQGDRDVAAWLVGLCGRAQCGCHVAAEGERSVGGGAIAEHTHLASGSGERSRASRVQILNITFCQVYSR